jgi:hypothetical protein
VAQAVLVLSFSNIQCQQQAFKYSHQQQNGFVQKVSHRSTILLLAVVAVVVLQELVAVVVLVDLEQAHHILSLLETHIQLQSVLVAGLLLMDHLLFLIRSLQQVVEEVQVILVLELMELLVVLVVAQ